MITITVNGLPALQAAMAKLQKVTTDLEPALTAATEVLRKGTASRADVLTGTYAGAQEMDVDGLMGQVYTGDDTNPLTGEPASSYAPFEEARGEGHAAYAATYKEDASRAFDAFVQSIIKALP